jgi:hypothetical protein
VTSATRNAGVATRPYVAPGSGSESGQRLPAQTQQALAQLIASLQISDERAKDETPGRDPEQIQGFLDSIHAHQYRYKDPSQPGAGHGTYVSPMAQEIEKTPLGKPAVTIGDDGYKRVDYSKLLGTMLAGQAYLNEKTNKLEDILSKKYGGSL